jgi:hypothetical protein
VFDPAAATLSLLDMVRGTLVTRPFDTRRLLGGEWSADHKIALLKGALVFGTRLSSIYALDIDLLMDQGIESVTTIGQGRAAMGRRERLSEAYGSRAAYAQAGLALWTTTTQVSATLCGTHRPVYQ